MSRRVSEISDPYCLQEFCGLLRYYSGEVGSEVGRMGTNPLAIPANNIICSLTDPEGRSLGAPLDLPQDAGPKELYLLINTLLQNVSRRLPCVRNLLLVSNWNGMA